MSSPVVDEYIDNGGWPEEFNGAWINIINSVRGNEVISLYFNDDYASATINNIDDYPILPDAYISVRPGGEIFEIFVKKSLQRNKIGAMLCAWARSYFLKKNIIVHAPNDMSDAARSLYRYLNEAYGEPYNESGPSVFFVAYKDFIGKRDIQD